MPTPESAEAFAELTKGGLASTNLQAASYMLAGQEVLGNPRYRHLQEQWEHALPELEQATEEFSAIIKHLHSATGNRP